MGRKNNTNLRQIGWPTTTFSTFYLTFGAIQGIIEQNSQLFLKRNKIMNVKAAQIIELIKKDVKDFDFDTKCDYFNDLMDWLDKEYMDLWDSEEGLEFE